MEKETQKLLPMPPLGMKECYPYEPLYNLPPTFKEGVVKSCLSATYSTMTVVPHGKLVQRV